MTRHDAILAALIARLQTITTANGYATNAGLTVFRDSEYKTDITADPFLVVVPGANTEGTDTDPPPCIGEEGHQLPVEIEGRIANDNETKTQSTALKNDILKAIKTDPTFGGLGDISFHPIVSGAEIEPAGEEGFIGVAYVKCTFVYFTAYGDN